MKKEKFLAQAGVAILRADSDEVAWREVVSDDRRSYVTRQLAKDVTRSADLIRALNALTLEGRRPIEQFVKVTEDSPFVRYPIVNTMLASGLLVWDSDNKACKFADGRAVDYLTGGWLEEFCWHEIRKNLTMASNMDYAVGVVCRWKTALGVIERELDGFACTSTKALVIEAKAVNFPNRKGKLFRAAVTKLQEIVLALPDRPKTAIIVSVFMPEESDLSSARDQGIRVLHGKQIHDLGKALREWFGIGRAREATYHVKSKHPERA